MSDVPEFLPLDKVFHEPPPPLPALEDLVGPPAKEPFSLVKRALLEREREMRFRRTR